MKNFAPVVPLAVASYLKGCGKLGDYHLLLAHDVLEHPDEYRNVYGGCTQITMDNSLIELGQPMAVKDVVAAAQIVGATKVVLPDHLGNFGHTMLAVLGALSEWKHIKEAVDPLGKISLVGVVQGSDIEQCKYCVAEYRHLGLQISIPRVLVDILGSRREIIEYAHKEFGYDRIHLLGFSKNLYDDILCTRMDGVAGIDSAVPIRAGYRGIYMGNPRGDYDEAVGKRGNYWELTPDDVGASGMGLALHNMENFRHWINILTESGIEECPMTINTPVTE